jgi:hypothetical protein
MLSHEVINTPPPPGCFRLSTVLWLYSKEPIEPGYTPRGLSLVTVAAYRAEAPARLSAATTKGNIKKGPDRRSTAVKKGRAKIGRDRSRAMAATAIT